MENNVELVKTVGEALDAMKAEKAENAKRSAEQDARLAKVEQAIASQQSRSMREENMVARNNIAQKFVEVRSDEGLKINSTGKDYYAEVVEKARIDKALYSKAGQLKGKFVGFQVPLISARPAVTASSTEGDTGLSVDSTMAIGRKSITPSLYYAILGITYQTEHFSMVTDAEIEDALAESFGETIENAMQSRNAGSNYPIGGLLSKDTSICASGNTVTAGTANACGWADLYALADKVKGKVGKWTMVVPTSIVSNLLATSTSDYNFCKEEYLRKGTIRGIEVVEVATAASHTAGDVYATVVDLSKNYKVCISAEDMILRRVADKNSLNTYIQGAMGVAGAVCLPSEVFQLVAKAAG